MPRTARNAHLISLATVARWELGYNERVPKSKSISTISAFVEWVEGIGEQFTTAGGYEAPWFRGVGDSEHLLIPSLYRSDEGREDLADDELRNEFSRRALPLVAERAPRDDWEWYSLMQHYRAPTRLLDWTDSALVALYFALTSWAPPCPEDRPVKPAVWALNPWTLNAYHKQSGPVGTDWEGVAAYLPPAYSGSKTPQYPIALDPTLSAQRMLVQHSHFTLHGHDTRSLDEMSAELGLERNLVKLVINADEDDIDYLRQALTWLGVTETSVFPDLEGLARELRAEYRLDRRQPKAT